MTTINFSESRVYVELMQSIITDLYTALGSILQIIATKMNFIRLATNYTKMNQIQSLCFRTGKIFRPA